MNRRHFLAGAAGVGLSMPVASAATKKAIFELRYFRLRNTHADQVARTSDFLAKAAVPALRRAGAGPLGFFSGVIAGDSPFILALVSFPSLSAMETVMEKMAADSAFGKARDEYNAAPDFGFERIENSLLRGFESMPQIEVPPVEGNRAARIFELRTYESSNGSTLQRKIKMFDDEEIAIFRRCGILPVFFGETIVGRRMPNLTYLVAYDDLAARDKVWRAFGADPDWQRLRARPDLADAEVVSNISNAILRPLPFSDIR
jgi:NIPSNAP protein